MVVILTGVSGSGKTTVGFRLAAELGWRFLDSDDATMPFADQRTQIDGFAARGENAVLACTALTVADRQLLNVAPSVRFVFLKGTASLIRRRLRNRSGHTLREGALAQQMASLEEPADALTIDVDERPGLIVAQIRAGLAI